jgi:gas vesicle protein
MSSRRKLKKNINELMELLYIDCLFYKVYVVDADKDAADKVMTRIAETQDELIKRVSATEGKDVKGRVKAYYKKLRTDLKEQANAIAKEIAALGK